MILFPELIWQSVIAWAIAGLKHANKARLKDAPTAAWSTTTCRLADFDVLAKGSSRIRRLFTRRSRGIEGSGGDGPGVWAGQGLFSSGREDIIVQRKMRRFVESVVVVMFVEFVL